MARTRRTLCESCKHVWRIPVPFYEETEYRIHGCTLPRKAKFAGRARCLACRCDDYDDNAEVSRSAAASADEPVLPVFRPQNNAAVTADAVHCEVIKTQNTEEQPKA